MSYTFSFSRLGKLIVKQLFENARLYIFSVLALFGLLSLIFLFYASASFPRYNEEETYIMYLIGLFVSGSIFASMSFNMLGAKDKGIYWLSIPATHLEKLITTLFFNSILFTAVYSLCFFIVKLIAVAVLSNYTDTHDATYKIISFGDHGFAEVSKYFLFGFVAVQSLYVLGSVYFPRYSFIITTVIGSALIFVFGFYMVKIGHMVEKGHWELTKVISSVGEGPITGSHYEYVVAPWVETALKNFALFVWAPLFWVVSWFRLKEKQI